MSFSEQEIDEIDLYAAGKLKGELLDRFKRRMQADAAFKHEVDVRLLLIAGVREARKQELKEMLRTKTGPMYISSKMFGKRWPMASAAILLLFLGMFFIVENFKNRNAEQGPIATSEKVQQDPASTSESLALENTESNKPQNPAQGSSVPQLEPIAAPEQMEVVDAEMAEYDVADYPEEPPVFDAAAAPESALPPTPQKITIDRVVLITDTVLVAMAWNTQNTNLLQREAKTLSKNKNVPATTDAESEKTKDVYKKEEVAYNVAVYKDPLRFKGYQLTGFNLKLYDVTMPFSLLQYNNRLFLKEGDKYFELKNTAQPLPLVRITDAELIKTLDQIK